MIILRRIMVIPFVAVVLALILLSSLLVVMNYQLMRPSFYGDTLNKVDFYNLLMGPTLDQYLEDLYQVPYQDLPIGFSKPLQETLNLSSDQLAASIRRAVPPAWLQSSTDKLLLALEAYLSGSNSVIEVDLDTDTQIKLIVSESKYLLSTTNAYNLAYQKFLDPSLSIISKQPLPLNVRISTPRIIQASRAVMPPEWIQGQLESALDEVTPYLVGDVDEFTVHIGFTDRIEIASEELKLMLLEANMGDILFEGVIQPAIKNLISEKIILPYGFVLKDEEIVEIMRTVAPPIWVEEQTSIAIDEVTKYIVGETDEISILIDITSNKLAAQNKLQESVNEYVTKQLNLPMCNFEQQDSLSKAKSYLDFPLCIPEDSGIYLQTQSKISDAIKSVVFDSIPDVIDMDQDILRSQLMDLGGPDNRELLDKIRKLISEGFTYTHTDLEADITSSTWIKLEDFNETRQFIKNGWIGDQKTLDTTLWGEENIGFISNLRSGIDTVKRYGWTAYLIIILMLVPIAFLGGRNARQRLLWGIGALLMSSIIALILFGPIYSQYIDKLSLNLSVGTIDDSYFSQANNLLMDLGATYWRQILSDIQRNLLIGPLIMFVVSLLAILLVIFWDKVKPIIEGLDAPKLQTGYISDNNLGK